MTELVHSVANAAAPASAASGVTPQAREALGHLAGLAVPPPVPWTPQTAGWAVLGVVLVVALLWLVWHLVHRWRTNRYRREALAELARLPDPVAQLAVVPTLLKRCALVAWPRERTASLHGPAWTGFVAAHARGRADPALARLLDDLQYRAPADLAAVPPDEARAMVSAARHWITHHRVTRGDRRVPA
jgi:hypothetical protein